MAIRIPPRLIVHGVLVAYKYWQARKQRVL